MSKLNEQPPPPRVEVAFSFILAEIKDGRIHLYRNVMRKPYIFCRNPKYSKLHVYLFDKDVRGWLTHFIKEVTNFLLKGQEIDRILEELAGRSMSQLVDKIQDPSHVKMIESEPVVAVVLEFMHLKGRHERTMAALWEELHKFAKERGLLGSGKCRFPGGANVLSRKLTAFLKVFEQLGITIVIKRSDGSQVTIFKRSDDSSPEQSVESPEPNSSNNNGLPLMDDKTKSILHLQQRKQEIERSSNEQSEF